VKEGQGKGGQRFVISIDTDLRMSECASRLLSPSFMYRAPSLTIDAHEFARGYTKRCVHPLLLLIPSSAYALLRLRLEL
jgi:hypothetical protein